MNNQTTVQLSMAELSPLITEVVSEGGSAEITVTGNSMYPMLKHRTSKVRLAKAQKLKIGDLPLYQRENGSYVLHRIVDLDGDCYTMCGDNQWHVERGIKGDRIVAVVTDYCRSGKWRPCTGALYRLYVRFWICIRPIRRLLFGGIRRIRRALCRNKTDS